jgi:hypothetical protein
MNGRFWGVSLRHNGRICTNTGLFILIACVVLKLNRNMMQKLSLLNRFSAWCVTIYRPFPKSA